MKEFYRIKGIDENFIKINNGKSIIEKIFRKYFKIKTKDIIVIVRLSKIESFIMNANLSNYNKKNNTNIKLEKIKGF